MKAVALIGALLGAAVAIVSGACVDVLFACLFAAGAVYLYWETEDF